MAAPAPDRIGIPAFIDIGDRENGVEGVQDGRISIERINEPFIVAGGSGEQFRAGIARAIALGWLCGMRAARFVKFADSGAALFA